jgi:hypothetical protein
MRAPVLCASVPKLLLVVFLRRQTPVKKKALINLRAVTLKRNKRQGESNPRYVRRVFVCGLVP